MTRSKTKTFLISFLLAAVAVCLSVALVACGKDDDDKNKVSYGAGEEGVYYYDKDASTEYLMTLQSGTYMISADGSSGYAGTYSYDGEDGISFKSSDGESFTAAFSDDAMQLEISGTPYTFLKKVDYAVKFMDGSSTVGAQTVTYGKSASKIDAEKDGYIFIGWYEDAAFTTQYKFNTAVTGDVTLYAYYIAIDSSIPNFEVQFVSGGDVIYTTTTQNGVVYDFPETEVDGWWVSATNSADELTYRYDGETLSEATKLFAVTGAALGASVYSDRVTWTASASTVAISVDGTEIASNITADSYSYDFEALSAGRHEVTVTRSGASEILVYVSHALARVSNFAVYGNVLVYNAVENAQYYYISVTCGNPSHDHTMVYNGNTLTYDFSNCEMGPDGITFTVYAYATGYETSVSETYVYALILDGTTVTIDKTTDTATWTAVSNASGYEVYINGEYTATTTDTEYSLKYYNIEDKIAVSVKPVAPGYYSEESVAAEYTKATLRAPEITGINEYTVSWTKIPGATNYIIYVNGKQIETVSDDITEYAYALDKDTDFVKADSYIITIKAVYANNTNQNSQESDPVYATDDTMSPLLVYEDGIVYWQYAMAAGTYYVSINDGDETEVYGKNSFDVTFTQSGENVIKVYFKTDAGDSAVASLSVTTYAVIFNSEGGDLVDTIYVAKGDTLYLPTPSYGTSGEGRFLGWYTLPNPDGLALDTYLGDGVAVVTGDLFTQNGTLILYACWEVSKQGVTLNVGEHGELDESSFQMPVNTQTYTMPVPEPTDAKYVFIGWYSEANGRGTRYTDEDGNSLNMYTNTTNKTIYAYWAEVLDFDQVTSTVDGSQVQQVSYGPDIAMVTSVTVPAEYDGLKVANLGSSAFKNCTTLTTIYLPDTIEYISTVNNGNASGSGAFAGANKIEGVYIYETGEPDTTKEVYYYSDDAGALYRLDSLTGYVELVYYPYARSGAYVIPEVVYNSTELEYVGTATQQVYRSVTSIATQVFAKNTKITAVTIPATIENIDTQAFYNDTKMETLTFNDTVEDQNAVAATTLKLGANAFQGCKLIEEITLPARYTEEFKSSIFDSCSALENIYVSDANSTYSSVGGMLYNKAGNELLCCPTGRSGNVTIGEGTSKIGESAFASITTITGVTIPSSMQEIGAFAFKGCTKIEYVEFLGGDDSNDLTICEGAFYGITSSLFTELELPSNLVKMEVNAFGGCTKLTTVTVHARATEDNSVDFAKDAFGSTATSTAYYVTTVYLDKYVPEFAISDVFGKKLEHVYIEEGNKYYSSDDEGVVYNTEKTTIIYYPLELSGDYTVPSTVTVISASVFEARTGLTGIYIPKSVVEIGEEAFYGCTKLAFVTFEAGGTEDLVICEYAFRGCTALTEISFPERTITIGDNALYGCTKLTYVYIPSTVTALGGYDSTGKLVSMNVFYNCSKLEKIEVGTGSASFRTIDGVLYAKDSQGNPTELIVCPTNNAVTDVVISGTVTRVWDKAFYNNTSVETVSFSGEVTLEDGQELFGDSVFEGSTNLKVVELPVGLTNIAAKLFYKCTSLEEVIIPYTVSYIGKAAFFQCTSLTTVIFSDTPEGKDEVPLVFEDCETDSTYTGSDYYYYYYGTFSRCESLEGMVLPDRTTTLGEYMFAGYQYYNSKVTSYSGLKSVTIGANVTEIADSAFRYADKLSEIKFAEGSKITTIGDYAFSFTGEIKDFVIPETVVEIGDYAFRSSGIKSVTLPSGITEISGDCFRGCANLKEITIPANVESLKTASVGAFYDCSGLESVTFEEGSKLEEIQAYTFYYCYALEAIEIPSSVQSIGACAFYDCRKLASITFAEGVSELNSIGNNAFYNTAITSFAFPETTATSISLGTTIFKSCSKLTSVTLSNGITDLGTALSGCNGITEIKFNLDEKGEQTNMNYKLAEDAPILYSYSGESIALVFGEIVGEFTVPYYVKTLGANLFQNQVSMTAVYIPTSVESIGDSAFASCVNLENVYFYTATYVDDDGYTVTVPAADSVTLGTYTFAYTTIKEINLSGSDVLSMDGKTTLTGVNVKKMGNASFAYCTSLEKVYMPTTSGSSSSANGYMGTYMFAYDSALTDVVYGDDTAYLGNYAFYYCTALTSVTLPSTVTSLGTYVFSYTNITSADLSAYSGTSTGTGLFDGCTYLTDVKLGSELTQLSQYLFRNCTSLKTVVIPEGVTTTNSTYAFSGCTALESVVLPSTLKTLNNYTFNGDTSLSRIAKTEEELATTPEGHLDLSSITAINTYAFNGCTSIKSVDLSSLSGALGNGTFSGCTELESVVLGTGVTTIGAYNTSDGAGVFQNSGLKSITYDGYMGTSNFALPSGITLVGKYSFTNCGLESVEVPNLTYNSTASKNCLCDYMFSSCLELTTVTFAEDAANVGAYMFDGCTALTSITLSGSVTAIQTYAFRNTGLSSIDMPGVTEIGTYAFYGCANLTSIALPVGVTSIAADTFYNTGLSSIDMPAVTSIGNYAFYGCQFTSVKLGSQITKIGTYMYAYNLSLETADFSGLTIDTLTADCFEGCTALESVTLSSAMVKINSKAFLNCSSLESVNTSKVTNLNSNVFEGCSSLESIDLSSLTNTYIYADCFLNCTSLATVSLPSTITAIYKEAFMGCSALESVSFAGAVTEIRANAFSGCTSLTEILLPETVAEIGDEAFSDSGLTSITLPSALTSLGKYVFIGCYDLEEIIIDSGNSTYQMVDGILCDMDGGIIFYPVALIDNGAVVIPDGLTLTSYVFRGYDDIISVSLPASVTVISDHAFYECSNLETVTFSEGVTAIENYAFYKCTSLKEIVFPSTLETIGTYAFRYDESLTTVVFNEGLTQIENYAFADSGITSAVLPSTLKVLGTEPTTSTGSYSGSVFRYCYYLEEVTLSEGLEIIGSYCFEYCTSLKSITIPESVTTVESYAFTYCDSLTDATVLCTVVSTRMFQECPALKTVTLADGTESIGNYAFYLCESLVEIYIPASVTELGTYVFQGCTSLVRVSGAEGLTSVGNYAFADTVALEEFTLSENVTSIGNYAFSNSGLSSIVLTESIDSIGTGAFEGWADTQTIYVACSYYAAFNSWAVSYGTSDPKKYNILMCFDDGEATIVYDYIT